MKEAIPPGRGMSLDAIGLFRWLEEAAREDVKKGKVRAAWEDGEKRLEHEEAEVRKALSLAEEPSTPRIIRILCL